MCRRPVPAVIATPPSLGEAPTDPYLVRPDPSVPQLDTDRSRLTRPPRPTRPCRPPKRRGDPGTVGTSLLPCLNGDGGTDASRQMHGVGLT